MQPANLLQLALKNNMDVFYTQIMVPPHILFSEDASGEVTNFANYWNDASVPSAQFNANVKNGNLMVLQSLLNANNVFSSPTMGSVC